MPIEDFINPFEKWKRVYCLYFKEIRIGQNYLPSFLMRGVES